MIYFLGFFLCMLVSVLSFRTGIRLDIPKWKAYVACFVYAAAFLAGMFFLSFGLGEVW